MQEFLGVLLLGLVAGGVYALVAIGYSLVYSVLGFINFAHGELLAVGAYACLFLGAGGLGLPLLPAAIAAMLITGLLSLGLGRWIFIPVSQRSTMAALVSAIGVSLLLQNLLALVFSPESLSFYPGGGASMLPGWLPFRPLYLLWLIGSLGLLGLTWFVVLQRTKLGLEIRACAANARGATIHGLRRNRVFAFVFFMSGVFAALAGVAKALDEQIIVPTLGFALGVRAFIACVIGGISSIQAVIGGAFLLGFLEEALLWLLYKSPLLTPIAAVFSRDTIALIALIAVLYWRPAGLVGVIREARP